MDINKVLSFDLWLQIATSDPESFAAINSINREIYNYTKDDMAKYKRKFTIVICEGDKIKYGKLPNGDKHGKIQVRRSF